MKRLSILVIAISAASLVLLSGCSKEIQPSPVADASRQADIAATAEEGTAASFTKKYVIEEGHHYANGVHFPPFLGTSLFFTAGFDNSAIYNFTDPKTKYDQNTLYGFADNYGKHQKFSARFGWRWFDGELQISAYTINNSVPTIVQIGTVAIGTANSFGIVVYEDHYDFILNGNTTSLPRASNTPMAGNYKLLPYFGGNATAPHRITIRIREN